MGLPKPPTEAKRRGSMKLVGKLPQRWTESIDGVIYEFEGDPATAARRRVVAIRSVRALVDRQKGAKIPAAYRNALLTAWNVSKTNPGVLEFVRTYLKAPAKSLYLWGTVGVGKTWAACTIANELLQQGYSVRYQPVSRLLLALRDTFSAEKRSELDVLQPLFRAKYLVLDELGDVALEKEGRASEFASSRLLMLLDQRSQDGKQVIITSNQSLSQLVRWCDDERIGSRIRGLCGEENVVELVGRDLRFDADAAQVDEPTWAHEASTNAG